MFEMCKIRVLQSSGQTLTLNLGDIVRCADTGYYFVALNMLKPQLGYNVEEEKGPETCSVEDRQVTYDKCKSPRYFGGPRVSPKIFETADHIIIFLWNRKFGLTFKTFEMNNIGESFLGVDNQKKMIDEADPATVNHLLGHGYQVRFIFLLPRNLYYPSSLSLVLIKFYNPQNVCCRRMPKRQCSSGRPSSFAC